MWILTQSNSLWGNLLLTLSKINSIIFKFIFKFDQLCFYEGFIIANVLVSNTHLSSAFKKMCNRNHMHIDMTYGYNDNNEAKDNGVWAAHEFDESWHASTLPLYSFNYTHQHFFHKAFSLGQFTVLTISKTWESQYSQAMLGNTHSHAFLQGT